MSDKKRILLVEDEPDILKITAFRLKKAGYEVITAMDGEKGLELAEKEMPGLILLDLGLPVMDGYEVCRRLKADEKLKKIPVVVFSASTDKVKEATEQIGADDYIVKPFEPEGLWEKVKKFIGEGE